MSRKAIHQEFKQLTFDELSVGSIHSGIVTHVMDYGIFVEISPGLKGLVLTKVFLWTLDFFVFMWGM